MLVAGTTVDPALPIKPAERFTLSIAVLMVDRLPVDLIEMPARTVGSEFDLSAFLLCAGLFVSHSRHMVEDEVIR